MVIRLACEEGKPGGDIAFMYTDDVPGLADPVPPLPPPKPIAPGPYMPATEVSTAPAFVVVEDERGPSDQGSGADREPLLVCNFKGSGLLGSCIGRADGMVIGAAGVVVGMVC